MLLQNGCSDSCCNADYDVTGRMFPEGHMRVMPHTDMSALTLLFQRVGELDVTRHCLLSFMTWPILPSLTPASAKSHALCVDWAVLLTP